MRRVGQPIRSTIVKDILQQIRTRLGSYYTTGEVTALSRILATELLGVKESIYFLKDPVTLTHEQQQMLDKALERLQTYTPIQHIIGYESFCGLRFRVNSNVLIPRPETQELVAWIESEATGKERILDIGTGSGCIAVSLAKRLPHCTVEAWDISSEALSVAQENSRINETRVKLEQRDILTYSPTNKQFDIIVSNPPYIREIEKESMEANVLQWEPHTALFVPDNDPLLFYRTIAQKALTMLAPGGRLYFEINRAYGKETCQMLAELGYSNIELRKDFADNDRMVRAVLRVI